MGRLDEWLIDPLLHKRNIYFIAAHAYSYSRAFSESFLQNQIFAHSWKTLHKK